MQFEYKKFSDFSLHKLKSFEETFRNFYSERLETSSLFLLPVNLEDSDSKEMFECFLREISIKLNFHSAEINLRDVPGCHVNTNNILLQHLFFENVNPGIVKNIILNVFRNITGGSYNSRLNRFGLFIPRTGKISCYTFIHSGGYYRFRLAEFKLKNVHPVLRDYLSALLYSCPSQYFFSGPRASGHKFQLNADLINVDQHEIINTTADALNERILKSAHEDVEKYFLETDPSAIAAEVPVWLEPGEMKQFKFLKSPFAGTLTGHIDLLRFENDGRIGIWDYKPRAKYEKSAHIQVFLYALMLSQRTGIPLNKFLCGYFDSKMVFYFNPSDISINN